MSADVEAMTAEMASQPFTDDDLRELVSVAMQSSRDARFRACAQAIVQLRARVAALEAEREGLRAALERIRDFEPELGAQYEARLAVSNAITNCAECARKASIPYGVSRVCDEHYRALGAADKHIAAERDYQMKYARTSIAAETIGQRPVHIDEADAARDAGRARGETAGG